MGTRMCVIYVALRDSAIMSACVFFVSVCQCVFVCTSLCVGHGDELEEFRIYVSG